MVLSDCARGTSFDDQETPAGRGDQNPLTTRCEIQREAWSGNLLDVNWTGRIAHVDHRHTRAAIGDERMGAIEKNIP